MLTLASGPTFQKCFSLTLGVSGSTLIVHIKDSETIVDSTYFLYQTCHFDFIFATHCQVLTEQGDNTTK